MKDNPIITTSKNNNIFLLVIFQSSMSLLPGLLRTFQTGERNLWLILFFIAYLLLNEFFQILARSLYKKGKSLPPIVIALKVLISAVLIFFSVQQTSIWYGIILLAYEFFQLLQFAKSFHYFDTLYFTLLNALFKGVVFNMLISLQFPYKLSWTVIEPFCFSFLIIFLFTAFIQGSTSYFERQKFFFFFFIISLITAHAYLYFMYRSQQFSFVQLIAVYSINFFLLFLLFSKKNSVNRKELWISFMVISDLLIYYF